LFLNHDYTEEDEEKHFKFIFFIFFSVIMVQKQNEQFLNEERIYLLPKITLTPHSLLFWKFTN
jgi:hypothetical protein